MGLRVVTPPQNSPAAPSLHRGSFPFRDHFGPSPYLVGGSRGARLWFSDGRDFRIVPTEGTMPEKGSVSELRVKRGLAGAVDSYGYA